MKTNLLSGPRSRSAAVQFNFVRRQCARVVSVLAGFYLRDQLFILAVIVFPSITRNTIPSEWVILSPSLFLDTHCHWLESFSGEYI